MSALMEFAGYEDCRTPEEFESRRKLINLFYYVMLPLDYKLQVAERGRA